MTYDEKLKLKLTKIKALAEEGTNNESIVAQNLLKKLTEIYGVDLDSATEEIHTFDFAYKNEYEKELLTWLFYKVIGVQSYNIYRDARIKKLCLKTTQLEYDEIMFLFNFYKYKLDEELKKFTIAFCVSQKFVPDETARCYKPPVENIEGVINPDFSKTEEELKEQERINKIWQYSDIIDSVKPIREGIENILD